MFDIVSSLQFRKDMKRLKRKGRNIERLRAAVRTLASGDALDPKYHEYVMGSDYIGFRHVEWDWLLMYKVRLEAREVYLFRTGTHSDLFS